MSQIISIQSAVSYGYVGNSAAAFALLRSGHDVWPVYTVNFSNHTGYPTTRGMVIPADVVSDLIQGLDERGALASCDALLSGYLGSAEIGQIMCDTADRIKALNPNALYCCDPVLGDIHEDFYTPVEVQHFVKDVMIGKADLLTPNLFELQYLAGRELYSVPEIIDAMQQLRARGPKVVLTTSALPNEATAENSIYLIGQDDTGSYLIKTPLIKRTFTGSGDLTAAVFLSSYLATNGDLPATMAKTAASVYGVLNATDKLDRDELALVQAQEELINPSQIFAVEKLS